MTVAPSLSPLLHHSLPSQMQLCQGDSSLELKEWTCCQSSKGDIPNCFPYWANQGVRFAKIYIHTFSLGHISTSSDELDYCGRNGSICCYVPHARWVCSLNDPSVGTVISPDWKKPKKHTVTAACSIAQS